MRVRSKKGAAEWYWIMIVIIIAIIVTLFILMIFTDFGTGIRTSFTDILGLTDTSNLPSSTP